MTHSIRLKDHWSVETESGRVLYSRRFGAPRIRDGERVWLTGTSTSGGTLALNGTVIASLTANSHFEVEVTAQLQPRNDVRIEMVAPSDGAFEGLVIEIRG